MLKRLRVITLLLRTAHIAPTLVVTIICTAMAWANAELGFAVGVGFTIFLGQLLVGWSNDLHDATDDQLHNRIDKPLATGALAASTVALALKIVALGLVLATLLGPLSNIFGLIHIFAVLIAIAYNFYFKSTPLSFLPYLISFGLLPLVLLGATGAAYSAWTSAIGSLFGLGAHFANVFKDFEEDRDSKILGLPQILGVGLSKVICAASISCAGFLLYINTSSAASIIVLALALLYLMPIPTRAIFPLVMAHSLVMMSVFISTLR